MKKQEEIDNKTQQSTFKSVVRKLKNKDEKLKNDDEK